MSKSSGRNCTNVDLLIPFTGFDLGQDGVTSLYLFFSFLFFFNLENEQYMGPQKDKGCVSVKCMLTGCCHST